MHNPCASPRQGGVGAVLSSQGPEGVFPRRRRRGFRRKGLEVEVATAREFAKMYTRFIAGPSVRRRSPPRSSTSPTLVAGMVRPQSPLLALILLGSSALAQPSDIIPGRWSGSLVSSNNYFVFTAGETGPKADSTSRSQIVSGVVTPAPTAFATGTSSDAKVTSCAADNSGDLMYRFGGDLWELDLSTSPIGSLVMITPVGTVPVARINTCVAPLDGALFFVYGGGGEGGTPDYLGDSYIFNGGTKKYMEQRMASSPSPGPLRGMACANVNGSVYIQGGRQEVNATFVNYVWAFNATSLSWAQLTVNGAVPGQPSARGYGSMAAFGLWFVVAGSSFRLTKALGLKARRNGNTSDRQPFYFFNTITRTWSPTPNSAGVNLNPSASVPSASPSSTPSSTVSVTPTPPSSGSSGSTVPTAAIAGGVIGGARKIALGDNTELPVEEILGSPALPPASTPASAPATTASAAVYMAAPYPAPVDKNMPAPGQQYDIDDLPPTYSGFLTPPPSGSGSNAGAGTSSTSSQVNVVEVTIYRGLCSYEPRASNKVALKLGDEIVLKQAFGNGWVLVSNLSTRRDGIAPISAIDVGKDFQEPPNP
ncbi:hypothetical protein BDK51DRAFT_42102 [Blyttiomyces helicus]|uniref:SH3 domain-containing protein n=1 Tax=Blyttiomyces helicus TaxID=388810 RepID=A0A4V1ISD3_9FUNG|nr:hypothetical protein BDK51DRAFT_42102 [Blyttiomyces helicus]|eukprot:RKO93157.1 hypothetical protein BDK51DRAFT_42102 [Blyttiomyces helicus]